MAKKRIGILTGGGDVSGLNAVIKTVVYRSSENDFEAAVFPQFPLLKSLHRKLNRLGASPARMTGSGSALFGVFPSREACERGLAAMGALPPKVDVQKIRFSSRVQYRAAWRRALRVHLTEAAAWPPI
jgi:4-diphosphocytidyl-2C-methyl-D-erythritol kinase